MRCARTFYLIHFNVLKITVPCIEHYLSVYDNLFLSKIWQCFVTKFFLITENNVWSKTRLVSWIPPLNLFSCSLHSHFAFMHRATLWSCSHGHRCFSPPPQWSRRWHARLSRSGPRFDPRSGQVSWVSFFEVFLHLWDKCQETRPHDSPNIIWPS